MKQGLTIFGLFLCVFCNAQNTQRNIFDATLAESLNKACGTKEYKFTDGRLVRRVNGEEYAIIDTQGLIVYLHKQYLPSYENKFFESSSKVKAIFSEGVCGKTYALDFFVLKKKYANPEFVAALKAARDKDYYKVSEATGMSAVNELYNRYIRKHSQ